jgi:ACR3 family arsenite efflux pump ArsB
VVFLVAASQVHVVDASVHLLGPVAAVFGLYLIGAAVIGVLLARSLGLPTPSARTVVFSLGTRNSFVVLPFALALPEAWQVAVVIVVLQSLVELWGMVAYLWVVPRVVCTPDERER